MRRMLCMALMLVICHWTFIQPRPEPGWFYADRLGLIVSVASAWSCPVLVPVSLGLCEAFLIERKRCAAPTFLSIHPV